MRILAGQAAAFMPPRDDAGGDVEPNREFDDLWLRFVSEVAKFDRQTPPPGAAAGALAAPGGDSATRLDAAPPWPAAAVTGCADMPARPGPPEAFRLDLSRVVTRYIGETEKNLDRVLGHAQPSAPTLMFDEADALFGKRSEVKDSHDR